MPPCVFDFDELLLHTAASRSQHRWWTCDAAEVGHWSSGEKILAHRLYRGCGPTRRVADLPGGSGVLAIAKHVAANPGSDVRLWSRPDTGSIET